MCWITCHNDIFVNNNMFYSECYQQVKKKFSYIYIFHWLSPLGPVSPRVALSVCLMLAPLHVAFFGPLIGPEITWSVSMPIIGSPPSPSPNLIRKNIYKISFARELIVQIFFEVVLQAIVFFIFSAHPPPNLVLHKCRGVTIYLFSTLTFDYIVSDQSVFGAVLVTLGLLKTMYSLAPWKVSNKRQSVLVILRVSDSMNCSALSVKATFDAGSQEVWVITNARPLPAPPALDSGCSRSQTTPCSEI